MEYRDVYQGHTLNAWTEEVSRGVWTWTFTIDDEQRVDRPRPSSSPERQLLLEAIEQGRRLIETYPASA